MPSTLIPTNRPHSGKEKTPASHMRGKETIQKVREARKKGLIPKNFRRSDLVKIGIPPGTAGTFLWKHCIDRDEKYKRFRKHFRQNEDGSYSLLHESQ